MTFGEWTLTVLVLTCAIASQAATQERRLKRSDLPAAVQKTADQESQGATVRGYSSEKNGDQLEYEVAMTVRGHNRDVTIAADGAVVEIEEEIVAWGRPRDTLRGVLEHLAEDAELITCLRGADAPLDDQTVTALAAGEVEFELSNGGQPAYWWLLSAE